MKEILKKFIRNNGGSVMFTLKCREREDIFGDIYNDIEDMFYQYADDPSNTCGPEHLQGYLIEVCFWYNKNRAFRNLKIPA